MEASQIVKIRKIFRLSQENFSHIFLSCSSKSASRYELGLTKPKGIVLRRLQTLKTIVACEDGLKEVLFALSMGVQGREMETLIATEKLKIDNKTNVNKIKENKITIVSEKTQTPNGKNRKRITETPSKK